MKKYFLLIILIICLIGQSHAQLLTSPPPVPQTHPRLLIQAKDLTELKKKKNLPEFQILWRQIQSNSQPVCQALTYLLEGDVSKGKAAIEGAYNDLKKATSGLRLMNEVFLGACVYDWCYDLMSASQKQNFINEFKRIHSLHAPFWPARTGDGAIVSHNSSGWFFHQLHVGVAIYNEEPLIWNNASNLFFKNFHQVRNFIYGSQLHNQGWYANNGISQSLLAGFLFRSLSGGKDIWVNDFGQIGNMHMYFMRPDKQIMRIGDVTVDSWAHEFGTVAIPGLAAYYKNPYYVYLDDLNLFSAYNKIRDDLFMKFLLRPANLERKNFSDHPLTKYFPEPVGADMVARTGWDLSGSYSDNAVVHMRIGQYFFGGHQHKDFGTFQIYYKGNLTGDSGMYAGSKSKYGSDHWKNYYRSTTAHNGLIIYDPNETYSGGDWTKTAVDGGIRWPYNNDVQPNAFEDLLSPANGYQMGEVTAHEFGPDTNAPEFSYISGDLTRGYTGKSGTGYTNRAKKVTRSMVTFNTDNPSYPAVVVVFDKMVSTNREFRKAFLLHSIKEPEVKNNKTTIKRGDGLDGKLVAYTLFPQEPTINKVEGYKVGNKTFDPGTKSESSYEDMRWRIEVSPSIKREDDEFLHVMAVMDKDTPDPGAEKIVSADLIGAKILDRIVTFSKNGNLLSQADFELKGDGHYKVLVCDVEPGLWLVKNNGKELFTVNASTEGKTLYFESKPGKLEFQKINIGKTDFAINTDKSKLSSNR